MEHVQQLTDLFGPTHHQDQRDRRLPMNRQMRRSEVGAVPGQDHHRIHLQDVATS